MLGEKHTCMSCGIKCHSLFRDLTFDELAKMESRRKHITYKRGERIYEEGAVPSHLLILSSGKVKISREVNDDYEHIVGLRKPVEFLGFQGLMVNDVYKTSATALVDSEVCCIHKDDFIDVVTNSSDFALKIIAYQAEMLSAKNERVTALAHKNMDARLADVLIDLADFYGLEPETNAINVQLKRKELASLSHMTTPNVIRALSRFAKDGFIDLVGKEIRLKNRESLQHIASKTT